MYIHWKSLQHNYSRMNSNSTQNFHRNLLLFSVFCLILFVVINYFSIGAFDLYSLKSLRPILAKWFSNLQ